MFTINIYLKFALIALCLIGGTTLAFVFGFWYAFPFLLIGIGLLLSYILLGTVQSAAMLVQTMQFDAAEKRLGLTIKPNWLYKTNHAFYYLLKGSMAMNGKNYDDAEKWLTKAQEIELPTDNEKAMVALQLANIHATKGKWNNAKLHFSKIKKLKVTEPQLKDQIKQFEKAITNRGQMKHARTMQGGSKGGGRMKRR
jgi:tetratricopeptide (TPR) repeat protein